MPEERPTTSWLRLARSGALEWSRSTLLRGELRLVCGDELREWYVKHAQVAGIRRFENLTKSAPRKERVAKIKMKLKHPSRTIEQRIFERDGYTCVYCGGGVVSRRLLHAFGDVMGIDFEIGTTILKELELDRPGAGARDGWSGLELHIGALCWLASEREVAARH